MMSLAFRNVDFGPRSPVRDWPYEALVTAPERGALSDWRRIAREVQADPWGRLARSLESYLAYERPYGVAPLMDEVVSRARSSRERDERQRVAELVRAAVESSGLTRAEFAQSIGTSASRLSTYCSGKVTPSAALLLRILDRAPERDRQLSRGSSSRATSSGRPTAAPPS
jgi:DNA-binding transcriptional regulator YiaG